MPGAELFRDHVVSAWLLPCVAMLPYPGFVTADQMLELASPDGQVAVGFLSL